MKTPLTIAICCLCLTMMLGCEPPIDDADGKRKFGEPAHSIGDYVKDTVEGTEAIVTSKPKCYANSGWRYKVRIYENSRDKREWKGYHNWWQYHISSRDDNRDADLAAENNVTDETEKEVADTVEPANPLDPEFIVGKTLTDGEAEKREQQRKEEKQRHENAENIIFASGPGSNLIPVSHVDGPSIDNKTYTDSERAEWDLTAQETKLHIARARIAKLEAEIERRDAEAKAKTEAQPKPPSEFTQLVRFFAYERDKPWEREGHDLDNAKAAAKMLTRLLNESGEVRDINMGYLKYAKESGRDYGLWVLVKPQAPSHQAIQTPDETMTYLVIGVKRN